MVKRKRTDNSMVKRRRTDNSMVKRRTDNTMVKRQRTTYDDSYRYILSKNATYLGKYIR